MLIRRLIYITFFLLITVPCLNAQKKELSQARTIIKSRKNIDKAVTMMDKLLENEKHKGNVQVWLMRAEAIRAIYEQGNERLYLNLKQDTAELFLNARKMFIAYEQLDSVDALPDKKGKSAPKYRKKHAEYLKDYRKNLFYGGNYFLKSGRPKDAYDMMETYINTATWPLFSTTQITNDNNIPTAAYVTVVAGYQQKQPEQTLKYSKEALKDTLRMGNTLVYLAETYKEKKETANYIDMLWMGLHNKPTDEYFFTRLYDHYNKEGKEDTAMIVVDEALRSDKEFLLAKIAKNDLLLNVGRDEECIALSDDIIAKHENISTPYYNAGAAYINMAIRKNEGRVDAATRKTIKGYYRKAQKYMEKYRAMEPREKRKWGPALYNIYLELNMGSKFEEIERLLRGN